MSAGETGYFEKTMESVIHSFKDDIFKIQDFQYFGSLENNMFSIIKRSMIVRQFEALCAIQKLQQLGMTSSGVPLLRSAYEELLWLCFLNARPKMADKICARMGSSEILRCVSEQGKYIKEKGMRDIGFKSSDVLRMRKDRVTNDIELTKLAKEIGLSDTWPPPFAKIAHSVGRRDEYSYIYQGTSRSVHFSPHELMRRVWGVPNKLKIGSETFSKYWTGFALSWSIFIFLSTVKEAGIPELVKKSDLDVHKALDDIIKLLPKAPIITAKELKWEFPSTSQKGWS